MAHQDQLSPEDRNFSTAVAIFFTEYHLGISCPGRRYSPSEIRSA